MSYRLVLIELNEIDGFRAEILHFDTCFLVRQLKADWTRTNYFLFPFPFAKELWESVLIDFELSFDTYHTLLIQLQIGFKT